MKNKNRLIILTGPSGVGKGTIEKLLFKDESLKLKFSVSATTRKPREGEINGEHYYFMEKEDFMEKVANNEFIEWNEHFNNCYGTLKSEIEKIIESGYSPFLEIETIGALNVMKYYKQFHPEEEIVSIFLTPPSLEELRNRIVNRGTESSEQIEIRLEKAKAELEEQSQFTYIVINETLEEAAKEISNIIKGLNK